jgi:hypothetical protein
MNTTYQERKIVSRLLAVVLSALLMVPLLSSCGGGGSQNAAPPPPVDDTVSGRTVNNPASGNQPEAKRGLSTGQKVGITLAGAAALYYLYNQRKNAKGNGAEGKYYLSKNGRVYYPRCSKSRSLGNTTIRRNSSSRVGSATVSRLPRL